MLIRTTLLILLPVILALLAGCQTHSRRHAGVPWQGWVSDNGDGTYTNPVLFADYSDPDVVRVGDDFYMTASSFNCMPALPILHSKDLVNWSLIGHAVGKHPFPQFDRPQHGNGVWAPSIRYHNGRYWIFYGDPDLGIFMTTATHPAGPWTPLHRVHEARGWIDPCPFWDDDGQAYLVHAVAKSRIGFKSKLFINRMSADGRQLLDDGTLVFDGTVDQPTIEGPKLYKRNGYYYIFAPAGGVEFGWQTVLRSRNIFGPYEDRIVLAQGNTDINGPHQGAWVELESGEHWFIHFQERGAYGRITHLQPMRWENDWPVIGADKDGDGKGEPVLSHRKPQVAGTASLITPATTDEFNAAQRGLQWQWHANFQPDWSSLTQRPGWLRLFPQPAPKGSVNLWPIPHLLLQKLPAPTFSATTHMDVSALALGDSAGLIIMGQAYAHLSVRATDRGLILLRRSCTDARAGKPETQDAAVDLARTDVFLRVDVQPGAVCQFSYSFDGTQFLPLGDTFPASEGRWIGAKVGVFSMAGQHTSPTSHADFDWFRFSPYQP